MTTVATAEETAARVAGGSHGAHPTDARTRSAVRR